MGVQSEGKWSNVKQYQHPHYHEKFQGKQEYRYQHYQKEDGILINIHGTKHHKTIIQHDIIRDKQL